MSPLTFLRSFNFRQIGAFRTVYRVQFYSSSVISYQSSKIFTLASCAIIDKIYKNTVHWKLKTVKFKSSTSKSSRSSGSDTEPDDEAGTDVGESFSDIEEDYDVPLNYMHVLVHSQRADLIVAKGLRMSHSEAEKLFYGSKFLFEGKTLLKKGKKIGEGEHVDILRDTDNEKVMVQRVKVIKVLDRKTSKGKPVIAVRVWKKPFELKKIS